MTTTHSKGNSINRLEGREKVTGAARYAAEYKLPDLLFGYVVNSTITKGKITGIHLDAAKAVEGVVEIFTHKNRPSLAWFDLQYADMDAPPGTVFKPLHDKEIKYNNQPIGLVVANDFETARYAASLVKFDYEEDDFDTVLPSNLDKAHTPKKGLATLMKPPPPKPVGDFEKAFASAPVQITSEYWHSAEHHNPMELFGSTVLYENKGKLTIYNKTQGTINDQLFVANVFGLHYKDVMVLAPYVGGGFGSGLRPQYQLFLAVMAALELKRNVRVTLDRKQMFSFGHRPQTYQKLRFSADTDGSVIAMNHAAIGETSSYEDYSENVVEWSHKLYPAKNTLFEYQLASLDLPTPLDMRAPGGATGIHAVECMLDELAYKLKMDPLELRLKNYSEKDPSAEKPYTSKELKQCYQKAAEVFGWKHRNPAPGSMKKGNRLVGYGMATGIWDAFQFPARVKAELTKQGHLMLNNATTDIGTGTLTVMTQIAADEIGLPIDAITFSYGDSKQPFSMFQGGSGGTASTGVGVVVTLQKLKKKLLKKAQSMNNSPFKKADIKDVNFKNSRLVLKDNPDTYISFKAIIEANDGKSIKTTKLAGPDILKLRKYSKASHSATFVEVEIDEELKTITLTRAVTAVAAGKIINPKTAKSQILGSMIWGMSKALQEETLVDGTLGKYMNQNLAEYHIPVHADIQDLQVIFAEEKDEVINALGIKGVGEIGIVAMPAAIANAIYHATGKRLRNLPMHFDQLL